MGLELQTFHVVSQGNTIGEQNKHVKKFANYNIASHTQNPSKFIERDLFYEQCKALQITKRERERQKKKKKKGNTSKLPFM